MNAGLFGRGMMEHFELEKLKKALSMRKEQCDRLAKIAFPDEEIYLSVITDNDHQIEDILK